ncbi:MAG: hypothetical protein GY925_16680 [Actinomycetia bacterium]|nr:hypothetical protein [Actinomycetes bacterium]
MTRVFTDREHRDTTMGKQDSSLESDAGGRKRDHAGCDERFWLDDGQAVMVGGEASPAAVVVERATSDRTRVLTDHGGYVLIVTG